MSPFIFGVGVGLVAGCVLTVVGMYFWSKP